MKKFRDDPTKMSTLRSTLNKQKKSNARRFSSKEILLCASKVWEDESIAELMAAEASEIIKAVYSKRSIFFSGRSAKGVLSGIFYLLSRKNKAKKTQKEIARSLNTNDVTVRGSYREWLGTFPGLLGNIDSSES